MTRDEARALFQASGLDYSVLTAANLRRLVSSIDAAMKESALMRGSYRMRRAATPRMQGDRPWASLRCKSFYFDDREAVTFNPDGFVGFAGWADEKNIVPVLVGFARWCAELTSRQAA